jgi:hypothetical protein
LVFWQGQESLAGCPHKLSRRGWRTHNTQIQLNSSQDEVIDVEWYLWQELSQIFWAHSAGEVPIVRTLGKVIPLPASSSYHIYILINILLWPIHHSYPWMLQPVCTSFQHLGKLQGTYGSASHEMYTVTWVNQVHGQVCECEVLIILLWQSRLLKG